MPRILCALLLVVLAAGSAPAADAEKEAAIRATALDYIEGWYTGDSERMERALHPDLAKRAVFPGKDGGEERWVELTKEQLVDYTKRGGGKDVPADQRAIEVKILDVLERCATVRVDSVHFIDYMHIALWHGEWKIVNVFWENLPRD